MSDFEASFGPKGLGNLAHGRGFAEPWVPITKTPSSEGAKASAKRGGYKNSLHRSRTTTLVCDVGALLRSFRAIRVLMLDTQGSAKPPPWARFPRPFGPAQCTRLRQNLMRHIANVSSVEELVGKGLLAFPAGVQPTPITAG